MRRLTRLWNVGPTFKFVRQGYLPWGHTLHACIIYGRQNKSRVDQCLLPRLHGDEKNNGLITSGRVPTQYIKVGKSWKVYFGVQKMTLDPSIYVSSVRPSLPDFVIGPQRTSHYFGVCYHGVRLLSSGSVICLFNVAGCRYGPICSSNGTTTLEGSTTLRSDGRFLVGKVIVLACTSSLFSYLGRTSTLLLSIHRLKVNVNGFSSARVRLPALYGTIVQQQGSERQHYDLEVVTRCGKTISEGQQLCL